MKLNVFNRKGEETGRTVELSDAVFGIEPNDHAIYLDVKQYMANNRQGTHKSKERSEVSGSTRKLIRQKGSGGARRGDINSPVLVGGGRVFGPKPRDYSFKLNKKVKALARRSALSYKAKENSIMVLEDFTMDGGDARQVVGVDVVGDDIILGQQGRDQVAQSVDGQAVFAVDAGHAQHQGAQP